MIARIVADNADQAMNRSIRRQARAAQRALERAQLAPAPPRYLYVDGHAYMLASHAAEQMERVMFAMQQPIVRFRHEHAVKPELVE